MAALVDTNILVYRFDPRFPKKQTRATEILGSGIVEDTVRVPHQAIIEFVSVVTRPIAGGIALLAPPDAIRESEELLRQFEILYPNEEIVRLALRGMATYRLPWFDAHIWAYAEHFGLDEILSEDFQHGRRYGAVKVTNPFID